jgi:serine/threonine protein kinase
MDIKVENLVYNGKKLYLIDFGLMKHESKVYKSLYEFDYPTDPPEFKRYLSKDKFIPRFKKNFEGSNLLVHISTYYKSMEKDLKALLSHPSYPTDKIDVYSLGIVIAQLYKWYRRSGPALPQAESLIIGMVCMDPERRYTAEQALSNLDLFLAKQ